MICTFNDLPKQTHIGIKFTKNKYQFTLQKKYLLGNKLIIKFSFELLNKLNLFLDLVFNKILGERQNKNSTLFILSLFKL